MKPAQAAEELIEALGDGQHVLVRYIPTENSFRRHRADLHESHVAIMDLIERLREAVSTTELQGWAPFIYPHTPADGGEFILRYGDNDGLAFFVKHNGVRYRHFREVDDYPIPRMVGESVADAVIRLVYNVLIPFYQAPK